MCDDGPFTLIIIVLSNNLLLSILILPCPQARNTDIVCASACIMMSTITVYF